MAMVSSGANQLTEYLLRTFTETWVEPTLRQLVKLESAYESDEVILAIAANKAQLFPKYGINQATDSLLKQDLTLTVNVGLGATDPSQKLQRFLAAAKTYADIVRSVPGINTDEVQKEIFSLSGYKNGGRFFQGQQLPEEVKQAFQQAQQQMQQLQQQLEQAQAALKDKSQELQLEQAKAVAEHQMEAQDSEREFQLKMEELALKARVAEAELELKRYVEQQELNLKAQANRESAQVAREKNKNDAVAKVASSKVEGIDDFVKIIADKLTALEKRIPA